MTAKGSAAARIVSKCDEMAKLQCWESRSTQRSLNHAKPEFASSAMATDPAIEQFIGESFSSIWDLELLAIVIAAGDRSMGATEIEQQMRGSQLVVEQGMQSLAAAGLISLEGPDQVRFSPVNETVARCAREAVDFYRRFPGRARRLMISRQAPGLSAFANAFRLRKDDE